MLPKSFRFAAALVAGLASTLLACSGSDSGTAPPIPARLGLVTEPAATAAAGVPLATQPVVQVGDAAGVPISTRGILVVASLGSGVGTLAGETSVRTDGDGRAAFQDLTLKGTTGPRTIRFSSTGLSAVISREITVGPGPASTVTVSAGNNQTAAAGTATPVAPAVRVADQSDNPVAGVKVTFSVSAGGGTVSGEAPVTNAEGVAAVERWTLGPLAGSNALSAAVEGLVGPALTIAATGVVGPAAQLTLVEGSGQSVTIGTAVPVAPAVKVADAFGNTIAGLAIVFTVSSGGGTVVGGTAVSDGAGIARVGSWRLGLTPGANALIASRQGGPSVTIEATGVDFPVTAIVAGGLHSCGVSVSGVRCWGDNTLGQLGSGTLSSDSVPVAVSGNPALTQIAAGRAHSCGLTADGQAWCWGANSSGQLGDSSTIGRSSPVQVRGGNTFRQLAAGLAHTCGLRTDGLVYCWGSGANGRLGNNGTLAAIRPVAVAGGHLFTAVALGDAHSCGLRNDGVVLCWGLNQNGRLGDGTTADRLEPTPITNPSASAFTVVSAGGSHTCALTTAGTALCWGAGSSGQLGTGAATAQQLVPGPITGSTLFDRLSAGFAHTCALQADGTAYCWGSNGSGRLGDGTTTQRNAPVAVAGGARFAEILSGGEHTCARSTAGSAICWGRNQEGQLGDNSTTARNSPSGVKSP